MPRVLVCIEGTGHIEHEGAIGGLLALLVTGTNFSVSSGVGFLALFGVSVQIGVIMVEYINQLRARGCTLPADIARTMVRLCLGFE